MTALVATVDGRKASAPMAPESDFAIHPAPAEAIGTLRAYEATAHWLHAPADRPRPVVLASYDGTRRQPNLTALLALLLRRYGVAVCIHGAPPLGVPPPMTTAAVLIELGIEPAADIADAQARLARDDLAYVPIDVLAPGVSGLRHGQGAAAVDRPVSPLVRLIDPFRGEGYRVIGARTAAEHTWMRAILTATEASALLLMGAEGEPFADPALPSQFDSFTAGVVTGNGTEVTAGSPVSWPAGGAAATATVIARILAGELPVPDSIIAQLGYCLDGVRR